MLQIPQCASSLYCSGIVMSTYFCWNSSGTEGAQVSVTKDKHEDSMHRCSNTWAAAPYFLEALLCQRSLDIGAPDDDCDPTV